MDVKAQGGGSKKGTSESEGQRQDQMEIYGASRCKGYENVHAGTKVKNSPIRG